MKAIKNDRASYVARSVIGGAKSCASTAKSDPEKKRDDFRVDSMGYFNWQRTAKSQVKR